MKRTRKNWDQARERRLSSGAFRRSTLNPQPSTRPDNASGERNQEACRRAAFTLVELVLVLSLIVVLAAITWPSINAMYIDNQLTSGADSIKAHVSRTRIHAIDSTLIYEFRYELGGRRFLVVPHEPDEAALAQMNGSTGTAQQTGTQSYRLLGTLPEKLQFAQTAVFGAQAAPIPVQDWQLTGLQNVGDDVRIPLEAAAWSSPILFYPDGSADNAQFQVSDQRQQAIVFTVRGLTGAVSTAPLREQYQL